MEKPVVSIIIPTYNQSEFLKSALQSVVDQTFKNWEAIVVNNYSTDNTVDIVQQFSDPRIRCENFLNHGVIGASRNKGIELAHGEIIAFLDSDDTWYPQKLARCLEEFNKGVDFIAHGLWIKRDGKLWRKLVPPPSDDNPFIILLYRGNPFIATSAVLIRKNILLRYGSFSEDPETIASEDYELWLRLFKKNIKVVFIPEILGDYVMHPMNASRNVERQMNAENTIVERYFKDSPAKSLREHLLRKKRRILIPIRAGRRLQQAGRWFESIPYLVKGLFRLL